MFTLQPPECYMEIRYGYGTTGTRVAGPVRVGDPLTLIIYMRSKYGTAASNSGHAFSRCATLNVDSTRPRELIAWRYAVRNICPVLFHRDNGTRRDPVANASRGSKISRVRASSFHEKSITSRDSNGGLSPMKLDSR